MRNSYPAKEKLFKRYQAGNGVALLDLLEEERLGLYDYLLRMTGQMSRSAETIDEVYSSLDSDTLSSLEGFADLKLCLYKAARRFNSDIWNADTAKLTNAALPSGEGAGDDKKAGAKHLPLLDRALRYLPGPEREAVLLYVLAEFEADETGAILGNLSASEAAVRIQAGLTRLNDEVEAVCGPAEKALLLLPQHPLPPRSSNATVNLSMVMQGLKAKPVGLWSPVRLALLGLVVALGIGSYLRPDVLHGLVETLKAKAVESLTDKPGEPAAAPVPLPKP